MKMSPIGWIAFILVIIGGLNWGFVGLGYNLVDGIFGAGSVISKVIYILVGLSALFMLVKPFIKAKTAAPVAPQM